MPDQYGNRTRKDVDQYRQARDNRAAALETLPQWVKEGLTRPTNFIYSGSIDLFNTWAAAPLSTHRDADVLNRANWKAITAEIEEHNKDTEEPEYITHELSSHWAVGWTEQVYIKVFNQDGSIDPRGIKIVQEFIDQLESYPILDEELFYQEEEEEAAAILESCYESDINQMLEEAYAELDPGTEAPTIDELLGEYWNYEIFGRLPETNPECITLESIEEALAEWITPEGRAAAERRRIIEAGQLEFKF